MMWTWNWAAYESGTRRTWNEWNGAEEVETHAVVRLYRDMLLEEVEPINLDTSGRGMGGWSA